MDELRVWLAYYIMPKNTRKYLIKALSDNIKELKRETAKLYDKMNADFYTHDKSINPLDGKKENK